MKCRNLKWAALVGLYGASAARAVDLESADLKLSITTGPSQFSFQLIDKTNNNAVVLSQSSTFFGANNITGVSSSSTGNDGQHDYINLNFSLQGGSTASGRFTLISPQVVRVDLTGPASTATIKQLFTDNGEHYYGTFQQTYGKTLDNRGLTQEYHGAFETSDSVVSEGARAPFYFTSKNAGIYTESTNVGTYQLGVSNAGGFTFNTTNNALRYDMIVGSTPKGVLQQFNTLSAPSFMPPTWALDSIWWRDDNHQIPAQSGAANAQALAVADADKLRQLHIPAGAIWIDRPYGTSTGNAGDGSVANWGNMDFDSSFPNPAQMVSDLQARGMNTLLWIANRANQNLLSEGIADGYVLNGNTANPAIDLTNPAAYAWLKGKLNTLVNLGIKGYKIDRGGDGEMPDSMTNLLPYLFDKLAGEGMSAANGSDYFNFARDPVDQSRQYAAVWNGDSSTTFTGLATSVKNGIRAGLINFPIYGSDTGGYQGATPTKELYARWLEYSAYCPLMEVLNGPNRNVWYDYDQQLIDIAVAQTQAHHDLIPYVRSQIYQATQTGTPVIRALILDFPTDPQVVDKADEYLYGPSILVAPVLTAGATSRSVYLPAGRWVDYNGKSTVYTGGQTISASAALDVIPLFAREGAIIPRGDIVQDNQAAWKPNWTPSLHVELFPSATVPSSFDYYTGSNVQTINSNMTGNDVHIAFGDLGTPGALELYLGRFYTLTSVQQVFLNHTLLSAGSYTLDSGQNLLTVPYSGATTLDVIGLTQWNSASNGNWSTVSNWNTGAAPTGASAIVGFGPLITSARTITVDSPQTLGTMNFTSAGTYTLAGAGGITLDAIAGQAAINVLTGSHAISTNLTMNDDTAVSVAANQTLTISGNLTGSTATLYKSDSGTLAIKNLNSAGLNVSAGKVLVTQQGGTNVTIKSLSIASGAQLDLINNSMVIDYPGAVGTLSNDTRLELSSGRLFTSLADAHHALGYADDGNLLRVKFTYPGDANLDGTVDMSDIYLLAQNWLSTGQVWTSGDFNYDGTVDARDLGLLAINWQAGTNGGVLGDSLDDALSIFGLPPTAVPEPMATPISLLLLSGWTNMRPRTANMRRNRRP